MGWPNWVRVRRYSEVISTSLSMAPVSIPGVRAAVADHTLAECRGLATLALDAEDGRAARTAVRNATRS